MSNKPTCSQHSNSVQDPQSPHNRSMPLPQMNDMIVLQPPEMRGPLYPPVGQPFAQLLPSVGQFTYAANCVPIYPMAHGPLQPLPVPQNSAAIHNERQYQ